MIGQIVTSSYLLLAFLQELQGFLSDSCRRYPTNGAAAVQVTTTVIVPQEFLSGLLDEVIVTSVSAVFFLVNEDAVEMHA